jgi:hypothetical protein
MMIRVNSTNYFGFGIGTAMNAAGDMWIFETVGGVVTCIDAFSKDYAPPTNDLSNGGTNDIVIVGQEYDNNGFTTVKFRRLLDTSNAIYPKFRGPQ